LLHPDCSFSTFAGHPNCGTSAVEKKNAAIAAAAKYRRETARHNRDV
jgi:hypothetical protein